MQKTVQDIVLEAGFPIEVRMVRKVLGLSQAELAQTLGVSFASVNRWENGKTHPTPQAHTQFENFCKKHRQRLPQNGKK